MIRSYKLFLVIVFGFLFNATKVQAQDPQFSQNYATPLYLNPAFTGANSWQRVILNYRNQWPAASSIGFVSYVFSYDYNISSISSGIGFFAIQDRAGESALTYRSFGGLYSYEARLTKEWSLRMGVHFAYTSKDVDYSRLLFNDQISTGGGISFDANSYFNVSYLDINSGMLLYNRNAFIGFAGSHLTEPNESFIGGESKLPRKFSIHGGYKFDLNATRVVRNIMPTFNYKWQGNFDQLDMGIYYNHEPLVLGIWYRGVPISAFSNSYFNNDAFVFLVGYNVNDQPLHIGYSYDLTVSGLFSNSGGSHEISLVYEFGKGGKGGAGNSRYNRKPIPCAKF